MLGALADPIIPIFAVMVAGFILARFNVFEISHAQAINRFVFMLAAPALVAVIFARAPLGNLNWQVMGVYIGSEILIYFSIAALAHKVFDRPLPEAFLLGMTAVFSNHVFFVLPIIVRMHGDAFADPVTGIIIVDIVTFCLTAFLVDALSSGSGGLKKTTLSLLKNPFIYAPVLGIGAWYLGPAIPNGIYTFADFTGGSAAPVSLFALGIILSGLSIRPLGWLLAAVIGAKLVLHPILVWTGVGIFSISGTWSEMAILLAAGPCGAMPLVIALQYGQKTDVIAKAILISTVISVFSLAVLL